MLTNAHSVQHHTLIKVKRRGDDRKYTAKIVVVGNECDIALLRVENTDFWKGLHPFSFGVLPKLQTQVITAGYPVGGDTMSITSGVVSRVEMHDYLQSNMELLAMQIDAAINSGSSGGPVLNLDFECVGIAFQSLDPDEAENVSYTIPAEIIRHFLDDFEQHGYYTGFPGCGFTWQSMEHKLLREKFGLNQSQSGILIKDVLPTAHIATVLQKGDVITQYDGVKIGNDGTIPYRSGERINFKYLVTSKFVGDQCHLDIIRDGKLMKIDFLLDNAIGLQLTPPYCHSLQPEYIIIAGLVFIALSLPYLEDEFEDGNSDDDWEDYAPATLSYLYHKGKKKAPDQQVVLLSKVLVAEVNDGYDDFQNIRLLTFNHESVNNLRHLAFLLDTNKNDYLQFDMDGGETIVLTRDAVSISNDDILKQHGITQGRYLAPIPLPTLEKQQKKQKSSQSKNIKNNKKRKATRIKGTSGIASISSINVRATRRRSGSDPKTSLQNKLRTLLTTIQSLEESEAFQTPVDPLEVPDYYEVIKNPMDLQTMETCLRSGKYNTKEDFFKDFMLLINNCRTYNKKETYYYRCAESMLENYLSLIKRMDI